MPHNITQLLDQAKGGDSDAESRLLEVAYPVLKQIAQRQMRHERGDHTLQATALVNEAYLELFRSSDRNWESRGHFFAYASSVMRHILVHHARRKKAQKRGGDLLRVTLQDLPGEGQDVDQLIALDEALESLSGMDQRKGRIVELRFFGGLNIKEISDVMGLSTSAVNKDLRAARGWLFHQMTEA